MSFKPNTLGLYDIGGNVWEWTDDWYDNTLKERVLRGGAWSFWAANVRPPWRGMHDPADGDLGLPETSGLGFGIGFRLARTLP
jgi:formylglycine-generating enzyme required for sulfatase activity